MFDVVQQKVVYTVDTNGQGQSLGVSGDAIIVAFDNCLSKLLAEPSFVQKVSKPIDSTPAQTGTWTSELPDPNQIIELPKTTNSLGQNWLSHTSEQSVLVLSGDKGFGTAFVISQSGFILTNYHVVQGQSRLFGKFLNGQTVNVRVIRTSPPDDVALLQIDSVSHDPIPIDLAIAYSPGDDVIAIGNPVDPTLAFSITKGIVSGVRFVGGRTLIQTDVAVNPGSSGGPLIEVKSGRAIGVVSSKLVGVQVEGIAFAIDIRDAFRVLGVSVK